VARPGGQPLPYDVRAGFEASLGADLGGVRIHTDESADRLNRMVSADAFTSGMDVFFRDRRYRPDSGPGRMLLAHELCMCSSKATAGRRTYCASRNGPPPGEIETLEYSVDVRLTVRTMDEVFRLYERVAFAGRRTTPGSARRRLRRLDRRGRKVRIQVERRRVESSGRPEDKERRQLAKQKLRDLPGTERSQINDEVDRRYKKLTRAKSTKISPDRDRERPYLGEPARRGDGRSPEA